jgi:prepilin signal peptidase PulO-like enzyme (type II secretory pathway)
MIPLFMRLRVGRNPDKYGVLLPVFLVWILLFALMLVLFPFVLVAALFTWQSGKGKLLLLTYPLLISLLFKLSGLHIEVGRSKENVLIAFL